MAEANPRRRENSNPVRSEDRPKLRSFDGNNRNYYDVELIVEDRRFFVLKGHLAMHSDNFDRLFFGGFEEKDRKVVELVGIDPDYFQVFLELINGEVCLTDDNVEGTLKIAEYYLADTAMKRCEEYLLYRSGIQTKKLIEISDRYHFTELMTKAVGAITSAEELLTVVPDDNQFDDAVKLLLFQKSMELHRQNAPPPPAEPPVPDVAPVPGVERNQMELAMIIRQHEMLEAGRRNARNGAPPVPRIPAGPEEQLMRMRAEIRNREEAARRDVERQIENAARMRRDEREQNRMRAEEQVAQQAFLVEAQRRRREILDQLERDIAHE